MTIRNYPNRWVLTGPGGAPAFDSDKQTFTPTDIKTGVISLPDYSMSFSSPIDETVDTILHYVNAGATAVLGQMTTTTGLLQAYTEPIGGTKELWSASPAMNNDSLNIGYATRNLGLSTRAVLLAGTFFAAGGGLYFRRRLMLPRNGSGNAFVSIPAMTITYQAIVGVI